MFTKDGLFSFSELSRSCLPCETPANEPMEILIISNFNQRRSHGGLNSDSSIIKKNLIQVHFGKKDLMCLHYTGLTEDVETVEALVIPGCGEFGCCSDMSDATGPGQQGCKGQFLDEVF